MFSEALIQRRQKEELVSYTTIAQSYFFLKVRCLGSIKKGLLGKKQVKLKKIIFSEMHYNIAATFFIGCYLLYLDLQGHCGLAA